MKNLCCSIIVLFMGLNAFAQTTDTVHKDTSKSFSVNTSVANKPMYVVNGVVYKGDLNTLTLNPDDISSITVLKSPGSTSSYGVGGANGVILIKTKAYENGDGKLLRDTVNRSSLPDSAIYVVDGVVSDKKLEGISPEDIESIRVERNSSASPVFGSAKNGVIIITTKEGAAKKYKEELSSLSADYKKYLEAHNNDDSALNYSIDGTPCGEGFDRLTRLSNLTKDKIAKVKFAKLGTEVEITTKK